MKISVIMPVYNSARYLEQSVQSVIGQTLQDWELICVDDGSTDGSAAILNDLARQDDRIRILNQANAGVTAARHRGVDASSGEYICFLDSDDVLTPDALESLLGAAEEFGAEIVSHGYTKVAAGWELPVDSSAPSAKHSYQVAANPFKDIEHKKIPIVLWGKLFHKELLTGFEWPDIHFSEDLFMTLALSVKSQRIAYTEEKLIYYRQHPESATKTMTAEKLDEIFCSVNLVMDTITPDNREDGHHIKRYIAKYQLFTLFDSVCGQPALEERFLQRFAASGRIALADFSPLRALRLWLSIHGYKRTQLGLRSIIRYLKV